MRTTQYAFILAVQVIVLGAMFAFGIQGIEELPNRSVPPGTSDVGQPPPEQGVDDLQRYLSG